ncbi:MAG: Bug family tripartite tricarboxylate transporter substrate binding protein [Xanthobacteraceae bacterium]
MIVSRILAAAIAVFCFAGGIELGRVQSYPARPIKLILPYTAGSPNDVLARLLAPHLSVRLGQTVVVDNRPGGGTSIGVNAVMAAEPDGHTLLFSNSLSHLIAPLVNTTFTYAPLKDFVAIATVGASSNVIVIANSVPATTAQEFVAHAKANPGKLNFGFGQGTLPQLVGEMFKAAAGIDMTNVPYKGGAQAITDLLGGRIDMNIGTAATLLPLHRAGKLKMIGYTGTTRAADMPDIPTMVESGYPTVVSTTYYGLFGRADLPADIVNRLNTEVNGILKDAGVKDSMAKIGFEPKPLSPRELSALLAAENPRWTAIVKATGFQM